MQKAIKRYQSTNGLRQTGDLDSDTLAVMGLSKTTSYWSVNRKLFDMLLTLYFLQLLVDFANA
jgi:Putative peptidoglycan binding domain